MSLKDRMKEYAKEIGIDLIGVTDASPFPEDEERLRRRGDAGMRAPSDRTEPEIRANPQSLLPGARTIVSAGLAYTDRCGRVDMGKLEGPRGLLSTYTRGRDYHLVLGEKLEVLVEFLRQNAPDAAFKTMVDNTPLPEKAAAVRAGLGWIGKCGLLVTESFGTFVFLGEILTDLEMEPDAPHGERCGACTKCVDACPTGALFESYTLNAPACISCITQTKGVVPPEYREKMGHQLYGCDACQNACPHNAEYVGRAYPDAEKAAPRLDWLLKMSGDGFYETFGDTSMAWRGADVLQRNALVALGNRADTTESQEIVGILKEALHDERPAIRAHAVWAFSKHAGREYAQFLKEVFADEKDQMVAGEVKNAEERMA